MVRIESSSRTTSHQDAAPHDEDRGYEAVSRIESERKTLSPRDAVLDFSFAAAPPSNAWRPQPSINSSPFQYLSGQNGPLFTIPPLNRDYVLAFAGPERLENSHPPVGSKVTPVSVNEFRPIGRVGWENAFSLVRG
jgi:hypothetical protein